MPEVNLSVENYQTKLEAINAAIVELNLLIYGELDGSIPQQTTVATTNTGIEYMDEEEKQALIDLNNQVSDNGNWLHATLSTILLQTEATVPPPPEPIVNEEDPPDK